MNFIEDLGLKNHCTPTLKKEIEFDQNLPKGGEYWFFQD